MNKIRKVLSLRSLFVVILGLTCCHQAWPWDDPAPYSRPVAVVSLASYDRLVDSVQRLGDLAGRPRLGQGMQGVMAVLTQGRGLAGLDTSRPWGAVISLDGSKPTGYAFLPVTDADKLKEVLDPYLDRVEDVGDGVFRVQGKRRSQTAYVKPKDNGWMFVCRTRDGIAQTPDNPAALLADLPAKYALALRLNASELSASQRERIIAKLGQRAKKHARHRQGAGPYRQAIRELVHSALKQAVVATAQDIDQLTVGWSLDDDVKKAALDMELTARQGSKTAQRLSQWSQAKTRFAGFQLPEAIATSCFTAMCRPEDGQQLAELLDALQGEIFKAIDAREPSRDRAQAGKEIVGGLLGVARDTVGGGRVDEATSLVLNPDGATLVLARHVADGPALEKTLGKLVEAVRKDHPEFVDQALRTDVADLHGVRLHTVTVDVPSDADHRDKVVQLIGEQLRIVVGIGPHSFYLAAGKEAMKKLRAAIDQSAASGPRSGPPLRLSVALGDLARLVSEVGEAREKPRARKAFEVLENKAELAGQDHITLLAQPSQGRVTLRLEIEQGALEMLGAMRGRP